MKYLVEFQDGTSEEVDVGSGGFINYVGNGRWASFIKQAGRGSVLREMAYQEVASYPDCNIKKITPIREDD